MSLPLAGRHAVVTGASRGIGAAIARELARLGATLTLMARGRGALDAIARELGARAIVADLASEASTATAFAGLSPAILVNNVGGAETAPFARTGADLMRWMLDLNLMSAHGTTRTVLPAMLDAGWGRIVNVASTAGLKGYAYATAYVAAKHALVGLTRALALEVAARGVTVNAVCPGYTETPMLDASAAAVAAKTGKTEAAIKASLAAANPAGRLVRPEEVAAAVGFLCLPAAAAINGACLPVSGGEI